MFQRTEYPRPQLRRRDWIALNGEWEFAFDDEDNGIAKGYDRGRVTLPLKINVPFSYQYEASGIGDSALHERVWYKRTFTAPVGRRALLCFNGADYETDVWFNGVHILNHTGGFSPFFADITPHLKRGENVLVVRCFDPYDPTIPRGKQSWSGERYGCWYIPNTGIWQSVWIDLFGEDCIESYALIPDYDRCSVSGEIVTLRGLADEAEFEISLKGKLVKRVRFTLEGRFTRYDLRFLEQNYVDPRYAWTPENPVLFDATIRLFRRGMLVDEAVTRFGLKKLFADGNRIGFNNGHVYQRLVLDQGYWPESGLTPPSAEALKKDIGLAIAMGFNGARKHQKIEDPYFYYYAEELGFFTWCEMPSAYNFCAEEERRLTAEWGEIVSFMRNFTSVVCYVPLNESWGVRNIATDDIQKNFARSLYFITKSLDPTRLISTNDGWECLDETDIIGIHDYAYGGEEFPEKYRSENQAALYPQSRRLMAAGCRYRGQPVLFTEFGGIAMQSAAKDGSWGYHEGAADEEEFYARYGDLLRGVYNTEAFEGFCYTQLTDVQQEVNGLLLPDRTPKFDMERIKALTQNK